MSLKVLRVFNCCKYLSYGSLGCSTYSTKCISWSSNYAAGRKVSCVTFTTSVVNFTSRDASFDDEKPKENKVKKPPVPKVTLLGPDNTIVTVATLEEIQKISTKKDLRLVKIVDLDAKSHRPIYKMMTEAQYMEEDFQIKKQKKEKKSKHVIKGEKLVLISERISDNDLEQRIKKMIKWLSTKHEVRVIISCPGESKILAVSFICDSYKLRNQFFAVI